MKNLGAEEGGKKLSAVLASQTDMESVLDIMDAIPGGVASYRIEGGMFVPAFFSDGVPALSGHTREEFHSMIGGNALNIIYEADRERVLAAAMAAVESGKVLDISYRMRHKDGHLIWIHLNGRRMDPLSRENRFYAVFTGMSAETRLFESIINETADGVYVIDKENYELLYVNESKDLFCPGKKRVGQKCYEVLHGKDAPCGFCTLGSHPADGRSHEMMIEGSGRFYSTRFRETDWNGIPAYVKYVQDITEEMRIQREKERLEQYFQTVVKHLPGGIAVVNYHKDGHMVPEFMSDGFAVMTGMTLEEAWEMYRQDALSGVHPDDRGHVAELMGAFVAGGENQCEMEYRLIKGDGSFIWVRNSLTMIQNEGGEGRIYVIFHDVTKEREERECLRQQYNELLRQHYLTQEPNALVVGHCNISRNVILEIIDHTDSGLLETFGTVREEFFKGLSGLVADEKEQQDFLAAFLNEPSLEAFRNGIKEVTVKCFIRLPKEETGRYAQFKVNMVETPDAGEVTGILTVTDITEQVISDRILYQLSFTSYDLVVDADLLNDHYMVLSGDVSLGGLQRPQGSHTDRVMFLLRNQVVPRDQAMMKKLLDPEYMLKRLRETGAYSFSYSITGERGEILTKNLTVSAADLRLGRVCLARADITGSVREQQNMLNVVAYTFEFMGFIDVASRNLTMYTRKIVLQNLPPLSVENYEKSLEHLGRYYVQGNETGMVRELFSLDHMLEQLGEKPGGYDFVLPYRTETELRYKQINVMWGNEDHKTVCMVRADVTDMLAAERRSQNALEKALALAEEANRAKSEFLSSMSHDIRTPMNAIMGMTALAEAHIDDRGRVEECLRKISLSSRHLLSLINDILDMSKIESAKITLNHVKICLTELVSQLSDMMGEQAGAAGIEFRTFAEDIEHNYLYGDSLRVNQILINLLSNAVKFTPEGGIVEFLAEEIPAVKGEGHVRLRFTIRDTGVGMSREFLEHIFEPFVRDGNVSQIEGTGLGLSITKGLVDLMGGQIIVDSQLHRGTEFRVELEFEAAREDRLCDAVTESRSLFLPEEQPLAGRRFLVAEDNEINSEILCEMLRMYGAQTVVKQDGVQAVRAFQSAAPGTYDAVLMDIRMPEMNGYDATRAIRNLKRRDAGGIPIIAMTANAFAEDIQASSDAGMTAHVAKPIDIQLLLTTLDRLLVH